MIDAPWHISKYGSLADCNGVVFANPTSTTSKSCKEKLQLAISAPELLAALINIRSMADTSGDKAIYEEANEAIAKAKAQ